LLIGLVFYLDNTTGECTYKVPVEYHAALGNFWTIQKFYKGESKSFVFHFVNAKSGETRQNLPPVNPILLQV